MRTRPLRSHLSVQIKARMKGMIWLAIYWRASAASLQQALVCESSMKPNPLRKTTPMHRGPGTARHGQCVWMHAPIVLVVYLQMIVGMPTRVRQRPIQRLIMSVGTDDRVTVVLAPEICRGGRDVGPAGPGGRILQDVSGLLIVLQDLELSINNMDFFRRCLLSEHFLSQAPIVTQVQDLIRGVC